MTDVPGSEPREGNPAQKEEEERKEEGGLMVLLQTGQPHGLI